jgi:lipid-binding SYLF domain-containing protein
MAESAAEIEEKVDATLENLYSSSPAAKEIASVAQGILVFPEVVKDGLIVGGQYGVGAFRENGKTAGYYRTVAGFFGLQTGAQSFGTH